MDIADILRSRGRLTMSRYGDRICISNVYEKGFKGDVITVNLTPQKSYKVLDKDTITNEGLFCVFKYDRLKVIDDNGDIQWFPEAIFED